MSNDKVIRTKTQIAVKQLAPGDKSWVLSLKDKHFNGADFIMTRGRKAYPAQLPGFYAEDNEGTRVGLITYEVIDNVCEIVTLDAFKQFQGIGTSLLHAVVGEGKLQKWKKTWLITTNDNLEALRFYQTRGFVITKVHSGAIDYSRKLKPSIPLVGSFDIPIRDEIEMEMSL